MHYYINGYIHSNNAPAITHNDRGLLLADGLFETILIVNHEPQFLPEHLARLADGASVMQIPCNLTLEQINHTIQQLLIKNAIDSLQACARITLTRGPGPRGLLPPAAPIPTVMITVEPYQPPPDKPWQLWVTPIRRNESSPLSRIKSLSYGDNILARMEAIRHGADDALFLNTQGYVTGTSMANIFILKNNELITPPVSDGALPGVMRAHLMAHATSPIQEAHITLEDCYQADEMMVSNALIGFKKAVCSNELN